MSTRVISLKVTADVTGVSAAFRKAQNDMQSFSKTTSQGIQKNRAEWETISSQVGLMGTAMVGLAGLAVKGFATFDKSLSGIKAQGGEAAARIGDLRDAAVKFGADTQYSAAEAAGSITNLIKAGLKVEDVLGGGLAGALSLAAAGEMDVKEASEDMATALQQFHLDGTMASHVADLLAAGANKAMGEVSDLAMALNQGGLVAYQTGLTIDETTAALAAFANQGLLGSDAGTSLKTMLQRLTPISDQAQAKMDELGISAYDAQGNFVGLANYAGQLKTKLQTLSPQARNLAMNVMFGSDAVRAANVLYSEGSDGIQKWIDSMSSAGFAARQAATLTDNLSGDLERLSGSVDTVAIQSGSGLNSFLRGATQGTTGLVNAVGELPGPLLSGIASLTALGGGLLLAKGAMMKGIGAISDYRTALATLEKSSQSGKLLASRMTAVEKTAKRAAIALAALEVISIFGSSAQEGIDKANGSLADMAEAAANAGTKGLGTLDAEFGKVKGRFFFWETAASQARDFGDALKQVNDAASGWGSFSSGLQQTIAGLFGAKTATTELREQTAKLDQSLSAMDTAQAQKAFSQISDAAIAQGMSVEDLVNLFPEYKATLQSTAVSLGQGGLKAEEYAAWMKGEVPAAVKEATAAHPELVAKLNDTQAAAAGATVSMAEYVKGLWDSANAASALAGSQVGYERMLDSTAAKTKELLKSTKKKTDLTNLDTKAGQDAKENLLKIRDVTVAHTAKVMEQTQSQDKANQAMERGRKQFHDQAKAIGYTETQIANMIAEYGLVPMSVNTDVSVTGDGLATAQLRTLKDKIKDLPKKTQSQILSKFNTEGIDGAYGALEKIDGKTAEAWIQTMLNRGAIQEWEKAKLANKYPAIYPQLKQDEWVLKFNHQRQGGQKNADGAIIRAYADGGFEDHSPNIYRKPAGTRIFNEPETEGEAYIPLAKSKRGRSIRIWEQTGRELGVFAKGGISKSQAQANARERSSLLAELKKDLRRGTITSDLTGGNGLSVVDTMLSWAENDALSKKVRSKLSKAALAAESRILKLNSQLTAAEDQVDGLKRIYDAVKGKLGEVDLGSALSGATSQSVDLLGNISYGSASASAINAQVAARASKVQAFAGKLDRLRKAGMSAIVLQEIANLGPDEGSKAADAYLADTSQISTLNAAYAAMDTYSSQAAQYVTEASYNGGLSAAQGMVTKLKESMADIGSELAASFASALGYKLSGTGLKKRALGGPVTAGELYQVNEQGVEIFRPAVSGVILTHSQSQKAISSAPSVAQFSDAQVQMLARAMAGAVASMTVAQQQELARSFRYAQEVY